jgi:hypothetical protein
MTKLYSLSVNEKPVLDVHMDVPNWMPVRPRLDRPWLRGLITRALRNCFDQTRALRGAAWMN